MTEVTTKQFDTEQPITINITSGPERKTCQVKFGDDAPWMARNRKATSIKRNLGRGKSAYDPTGSEAAEMELFNALRADTDGSDFDEYEAAAVIGKLERISEISAVRVGDQFEVRMKALGCDLLHVLKIPTQAAMIEYSRYSVRVVDQKRTQNVTVLLEPSAELFKKLVVRSEGYVEGRIPVIHKAAAISELMSELGAEDDEPTF